jgi:predicted Zn-dependent peptidase
MKTEFKRKVLKNGMTILFEKRKVPVVSVAFAVRCGGINEAASEKGISHFIEHMLYKGTPTRNAKKIAEEIEKRGGILNGFTDEMITAFWCKMPSKHLGVALDVLSDMIKNPLFDEKELEKERKVIFEEIKMRRDEPQTYVNDEILSFLYRDPFGSTLIGNLKSMKSIDKKKILERFENVYKPNNMVLCVVGDANFNEIVDFVKKNFGNQKGKVSQFKIVEKNGSKIEKRRGIDQASLILGFHSPKSNQKGSSATKLLVTLMSKGLSSRLFREIREKRNLAYSIWGHSDLTTKYGFSKIYIGTSKENVLKVKKLILEEFKKVSENMTEFELEQVKEQMIGHWQISMEDSDRQLTSLLFSEIEDGNAKEFYDFEKKIRAVKLEDVKKLARIKKYSFFVLEPSS